MMNYFSCMSYELWMLADLVVPVDREESHKVLEVCAAFEVCAAT